MAKFTGLVFLQVIKFYTIINDDGCLHVGSLDYVTHNCNNIIIKIKNV